MSQGAAGFDFDRLCHGDECSLLLLLGLLLLLVQCDALRFGHAFFEHDQRRGHGTKFIPPVSAVIGLVMRRAITAASRSVTSNAAPPIPAVRNTAPWIVAVTSPTYTPLPMTQFQPLTPLTKLCLSCAVASGGQ